MPQSNQDIVNSQEFKDFRKNNNLEVLNLEAICVLLFQFQQRQNEIARHIQVPKILKFELLPYDNITSVNVEDFSTESLFDKWNN